MEFSTMAKITAVIPQCIKVIMLLGLVSEKEKELEEGRNEGEGGCKHL